MNNKKIVAVLALGFGIAAQAFGATVYVSKAGDDSTGDGTAEKPYRTIQKGVDAANGGDTVIVGAGDYSDLGGVYKVKLAGDTFEFQVTNVVYINKQITLQGAGRGKTFITGRYGDGTTAQDGSTYTWDETGNGAVRCVLVTVGGAGTIIKGFTIRKGSTVRAKTNVNNDVDIGGGVVAVSGTVYMYDCDITDCRAGDGAAVSRAVRCCRCYFARNKAKSSSGQVFYRNSYTFNCLFEDNGGGSGTIFTSVQAHNVVNCTFINNKVSKIFSVNANAGNTVRAYNCLVIGSRTLDVSSSDYLLVNVVQDLSTGAITKYADSGCKWGVSPALQYFSPATNDWRSVEGNDIVSKGDASLVTTENTGMQSADLSTDYNGNPRIVGGKVSVGCFEPTSTVSADDYLGSFKFAGGAKVTKGSKTISGEPIVAGRWWGLEGGIGQVRVGYTGESELFGYEVANVGTYLGGESYTTARFPDNNSDKGFWLTPTKGGIMTITAIPSTGTVWVDDDADESVADGTEDNPYKLISEAVSNVTERGIVKVKPGVYGSGVMCVGTTKYRVHIYKDVAIRSTHGAEKTVLKGGGNVHAIVRHNGNATYGHVQGFTLTGCANDPSVDENQGVTGSALLCDYGDIGARNYSEKMHLTDSIISNNVSSGRACTGGWLERCLLIDNFTTVENMNKGTGDGCARGTQAFSSILSGCVSYYSPIYYTAGHYPTVNTCAHQNCTDINCTFYIPNYDAGNRVYRTFNTPNGCTVAINNASVSPELDSYAPSAILYAAGNISSPGANVSTYTKVVAEDGFFAYASNRDFRPVVGSEGLGYSVVAPNQYVRYETGDFNGNALAYEINGGKPIPGAFQEPVKGLIVTCDQTRGQLTQGRTTVDVSNGQKITVSVSGVSGRPLFGWLVDGNVVENKADSSYTYTIDLSKSKLSLSPLFVTNLYVNAKAENDDGNGYTKETAKKRLSSIAAMAVSGDVIHAAEGDYNEGEMLNTKKGSTIYYGTVSLADMYSRVKVPDGVTLKADGSREKTFIVGRWHASKQRNGPAYGTTGVDPDAPNNALRCVMLGHNSVVDGFVLTNGCGTGSSSAYRDDNVGGGALGFSVGHSEGPSYVKNCTITGSGGRDGAVAGCVVENCYLYDNTCTSYGSCSVNSRLVNCLIYNTGNVAIHEHCGIYGSTIIDKGSNVNGLIMEFNSTYEVVNTILDCPTRVLTYYPEKIYYLKNWHTCIVPAWATNTTAFFDDATCSNLKTNTLAQCKLNANDSYAPNADSPAVDAGDVSLMEPIGGAPEKDYRGMQRVYNGQIDIGANEFDWRPTYKTDLDSRLGGVAEASAGVTEVVDGTTKSLKLFNGNEVKVTLPDVPLTYKVNFSLSSGTLKVLDENRTVLGAYTANDTHSSISDASGKTIYLRYENDASDAYALLGPFDGYMGLQLIFN